MKEKRRVTAQQYAIEIADLMVDYEAQTHDYRKQEATWKQMRKKLAQYKLACKRENIAKEEANLFSATGNRKQ